MKRWKRLVRSDIDHTLIQDRDNYFPTSYRAREKMVVKASGLMDAAVTAHYWFHYIRFLKPRPITVGQAVRSTCPFIV